MFSTTCVFSMLFLFYLCINVGNAAFSNELNTTETCVQLYEKGVGAYLENDYEECVVYFENAIKKYRAYTKKLQNCRLKCQEEAQYSEPLFPVDIENLLLFERAVKTTLCIIKCKKNSKEIAENVYINKETEVVFETRKPYEYLHICYYQTKEIEKAASAAFTYLVEHPEDKVMASNLKYYTAMDGVDKSKIVNFEAKDYVYFYAHGANAYVNQDWKSVINNMEESLASYLHSENECRAQCEGSFDHGWYPDFIPSISNHFTFCLRCKMKCKNKLSNLNGERHNDLLPSHYHYLQFAYFKTKKLKAACEAVASYLLFYPDDDTMLSNMKYYKKLPKVEDNYFTPRSEAVKYVQRQTYEDRLFNFITREFTEPVPEAIAEDSKQQFHIVWTEKQLRGQKRLVSDGLASSTDCKRLINVAKTFGISGDGYDGNISPHTTMEKFEGVSISRAGLLTHLGLLNPMYLGLLIQITEEVRIKIQEYFKLGDRLYFSFTHLVCRSALPDSPKNRTDLSHSIHADNCNIFENGTCDKSPPSFGWRDYSAILYLNRDFDGGEFIFTKDLEAKHIQGSVKPKCGRMVAFSSGKENLHGVKAVKRGTRCAVGLWFTFDPNHVEIDRENAAKVLNKFKHQRVVK